MMLVRDVMTRSVHVVGPETPLKDVARLLVDERISGVPVVDSQGGVVGVVSEADFLIKEQGAEAVHHRPLAASWANPALEGRVRQARRREGRPGDKLAADHDRARSADQRGRDADALAARSTACRSWTG